MKLVAKTCLREAVAVVVVVVVATLALVAASLPSVEFDDHIQRIIRSEDTDGYDTAVISAVDTATRRERRQTQRDLHTLTSDLSSNKRELTLQLTSGKRLRMSLERRAVDLSGARFREISEAGEREISVAGRDCYFSGPVEGGGGFASLALCDGELVGSITTSTRDYDLHTLPQTHHKRKQDDVMHVLVTWQDHQPDRREVEEGLEIPDEEDDNFTESQSGRRSVADRQATIEIGDYVDRFFIADVKRKLGVKTNEKILQLIIAKWSGAAHTLSDQDNLGWNITLRLVSVVIMRTDPSWYQAAPLETMGSRMKKICQGTKSNVSYDQLTLHTGDTSNPRLIGLAWLGGLCRRGARCSANKASNRNFRTELHELGHSMGLPHDSGIEQCRQEQEQTKGFMGGNRDHVRPCYGAVLNTTLVQSKHACIFSNAYSEYVQQFD